MEFSRESDVPFDEGVVYWKRGSGVVGTIALKRVLRDFAGPVPGDSDSEELAMSSVNQRSGLTARGISPFSDPQT